MLVPKWNYSCQGDVSKLITRDTCNSLSIYSIQLWIVFVILWMVVELSSLTTLCGHQGIFFLAVNSVVSQSHGSVLSQTSHLSSNSQIVLPLIGQVITGHYVFFWDYWIYFIMGKFSSLRVHSRQSNNHTFASAIMFWVVSIYGKVENHKRFSFIIVYLVHFGLLFFYLE